MATIHNIGETVSYEVSLSRTEANLMGHVEVKLESQNTQNKTSYINVKLYLYRSTASNPISNTTFSGSIWIYAYSGNLTVNYSTYVSSLGTSKVLVANNNFTVTHNNDGTYSEYINFTCAYTGHLTTTNSESLTLPSLLVSIPFSLNPYTDIYTTLTNIYVTIGGSHPEWSYTLKVRNTSGDTYTLFSDRTGTYWSGVLPNEVNYLFPNSSRATLYFDLTPKTPLGVIMGTYTVYRTVIVGSHSGPSIDTTRITDAAVNADGSPYSGGYIAGVSYLKLTIPCEDFSGSTVNNIKTVIDGRECVATPISGSSGWYKILTRYPLSTSGTLTLSIVATNNRGYSSTYSYTVSEPIQPYFIPEINIFSVIRCDSNGVAASESSNIKVTAKMSFRASVQGSFTNMYYYKLYYKLHSASVWSEITATGGSGSGTATSSSGNICEISIDQIFLNLFNDPTLTYDVKLLIYDTLTGNVGTEVYKIIVSGIEQVILDFMYDGSAAAVGKTAEDSGIFDIGWTVRFSGGLYPKKLTESGSTYDLNNLKAPGFYYYSSLEGGTISNLPPISGGVSGNYGITVFPTGVSSVLQLFIPEAVGSDPSIYMRTVSSTTQVSSWKVITGASL